MIQSLNDEWVLHSDIASGIKTSLPCSVYDCLYKAGKIPDPYRGLNQYAAKELSEGNYSFDCAFTPEPGLLSCEKVYLRFYGVDTLADIELNGAPLGKTANMHRTYEFDVTKLLRQGENLLRVRLYSPLEYVRKAQEKDPLWGVSSTTPGFPHIRKAHYMFGWDWGPELPDMGIWRGVELVGVKAGRIDSLYVRQEFSHGSVKLVFDTRVTDKTSDDLKVQITVTAPFGKEYSLEEKIVKDAAAPELTIESPQLWYPRGYGEQPLYTVNAVLMNGDAPADVKSFSIGLRTVEVCRDKDEYGEEFCFKVNGMKIFAMGANYVPEDNILPRRSRERTEKLLLDCAAANFNMVRVWGGGFYPDDWFYDECDRLGLLVWQDLAFACAVYNADGDFSANVRQEVIDNVKRIRNHPSLAMWCGNNEIESAILGWGVPVTEEQKAGYLRIFEKLIPTVIRHYDPQTFYWPSSPSSGGGYNDPSAEDKGDSHYWAVWHGLKPFEDFREHKFRFCSEYGFESIPDMRTVRSFAEEKDLNLCSPVMEAHQYGGQGNEKLLYYMAQMVRYPYSFEGLQYATQLVQAEYVRLAAEHMRRHRGQCMGSLYWQLNDSDPVISWSSVDYFGRRKALQYYAKRFYAPVLCSVDDSDKENLVFNISNERNDVFSGLVRWRVRRNDTAVIAQGESAVRVPPLSARDVFSLTPRETGLTPELYRTHYIEYSLVRDGTVTGGGTVMLVPMKKFEFLDPAITVKSDALGDKIRFELTSAAFAKGVFLEFPEYDIQPGDNWFDLHGKPYSVLVSRKNFPPAFTPPEIAVKLRVRSYYDYLAR